MEKVESALDVLSRAATMVQPCPAYPASDSDGFVAIKADKMITVYRYAGWDTVHMLDGIWPCGRVAFLATHS
ncbi:unnamed protein product [Pieris macdunnoughi]|uniref:Uncharacterized protein n=1 Tax=Pieris macdunnoughi TaxID=345717 RepID=A0A821UZ79_9NEOP|nr:unnamed protein product [Pieris macdunnoughi]